MIQRVFGALGGNRFIVQGRNEDDSIARMCAERVHNFSSQYGGESSRGYTASNLAGESCKYPNYGDFSEACVMRTYGPWWSKAPSAPLQIGRKEAWFVAEDFIDLFFPNTVNPERIDIYETYNPGAVVRILSCNKAPHESYISGEDVCWEVLWSGPSEKGVPAARCFSPKIRKPNFPTRLIRIELCQSHCDYYTELDAVYLSGASSNDDASRQKAIDSAIDYLNFTKLSMLDKDDSDSKHPLLNGSSVEARECLGHFQVLPDEIVTYLLSFLTLKDFAALAQSCRFFRFLCYDPVWYKELNLKPFWSKISDATLESLKVRCSQLEKLDSSWLGALGSVTAPVFQRFINFSGSNLTNLRLAACEFVNESVIEAVTISCTNLTEINLSSCHFEDPDALRCLTKLKRLKHLNLYRIPLQDDILLEIFRNCKEIQFLNIGSNIAIENGNAILEGLSENCQRLRGIDMWRCKTVNAIGVSLLSKSCREIEELDFGWCSNIKSHGPSIILIAENCRRLKKLFLTAIRSINNDDIGALAEYSSGLEQFDILGTGNITSDSVRRLLTRCTKLKLLDISFCSSIDAQKVKEWRREFPSTAIKKSFTN